MIALAACAMLCSESLCSFCALYFDQQLLILTLYALAALSLQWLQTIHCSNQQHLALVSLMSYVVVALSLLVATRLTSANLLLL